MKKVLAIALIAGSLVACNNSGEKTETKDTTATTVDTTAAPAPVVDTTAAPVVDTTAAPAAK